MERRIKDARTREVYESMNAVQDCDAMAEEGSWLGLDQVREPVETTNQGVEKYEEL